MKKILLYMIFLLSMASLWIGPMPTNGTMPPALIKEEIIIETQEGIHSFIMELALNDAAQETGLMHRTSLGENEGMLFVFETPRIITMWMKDTPISLDMLFIDETGKIIDITTHAKPNSLEYITPSLLTKGVIEVKAGTVEAKQIKPGDRVISPYFTP